MALPQFTIGIEEEYQIIDPETRALSSYVQDFLEEGRYVLREQIKPELMQSQVEVGSHICRNMREARQEVTRLRRSILEIAEKHDRWVAAASTHPFSKWATQQITVREGIGTADAKAMVKQIKASKLKVQAAIQGDQLRVTGKKRDDLQAAIALLKEGRWEVPLQFRNFRD